MPFSLNGKKSLIEANVLTVNRIQIGLAHAEVINRIQNIRFPAAVLSNQAINSWTKIDFDVFVIFEIDEV